MRQDNTKMAKRGRKTMVERERDIIVSRKKIAKRGRKNNGREVK